MVACVIPHEFQGINTEVTVTESSVVRLNSLLSYPCFLYILPNMLPVRMILIYWSAVAKFMNKPEHTVDETRLKRFFIKRTKTDVILPNIPLAVILRSTWSIVSARSCLSCLPFPVWQRALSELHYRFQDWYFRNRLSSLL